jgi:hypothetical protein
VHLATASNAAAPSASAKRLAAGMALDCLVTRAPFATSANLGSFPWLELVVVGVTGEVETRFLGSIWVSLVDNLHRPSAPGQRVVLSLGRALRFSPDFGHIAARGGPTLRAKSDMSHRTS